MSLVYRYKTPLPACFYPYFDSLLERKATDGVHMNLKWLLWVMKKHLEKRYSCIIIYWPYFKNINYFDHSLSFCCFLLKLSNLYVTLIIKGFLSAKDERDQRQGLHRMEESRWANTVHVMVVVCIGPGIDIKLIGTMLLLSTSIQFNSMLIYNIVHIL